MNLEMYLRTSLNKKWLPLVKKDKCEICGNIETLEVHHSKEFIVLLDEILKLLKLVYKDTNEYTKDELKIIKLIILGKHLEIKYETLCEECHIKKHKELKTKLQIIKEQNLLSDIIKLKNKLDDMKNIKLFKEEQDEFKMFLLNKLVNKPKVNHNSLGLKTINNLLNDYNLKYVIKSKREKAGKDKGKYYWTIN